MKQILTVLCLLFTLHLSSFGQDTLDNGKKLGIVAYLTYTKALSEAKMTSLAANEQYEKQPEKALKFNSDYNLLKLATDKLINQISADLYSSNNLKLYKCLNKFLAGTDDLPSKFNHYKPLIDEIDGRMQSFMIRSYSSAMGGASIENITGIVELGHTIIADARDFREKKIQSITGLLKELHFQSLSDLVKPKEKEKEQEKVR